MTTTALLVSTLIIGFQVLIWISGFIFSFLINPLSVADYLKNSTTTAVFIIMITSYSLGIIFDYIISWVFELIQTASEKKILENVESIKIRSADHEVHKYLDNFHQGVKIARGIVFNLPFLILSALTFIHKVKVDLHVNTLEMKWIIIISGLVLFILACMSWYKRNKRYLDFVQQIKELPWYQEFIFSKKLKDIYFPKNK